MYTCIQAIMVMEGFATMYMRMPMSSSTLPIQGKCSVDDKTVNLKFPFTGIEFELPSSPKEGRNDFDFKVSHWFMAFLSKMNLLLHVILKTVICFVWTVAPRVTLMLTKVFIVTTWQEKYIRPRIIRTPLINSFAIFELFSLDADILGIKEDRLHVNSEQEKFVFS